jgi:hypothetical protein
MKREKREEIVKKGVVEHERLSQQFDKKEKELRRQYDELRKRFEEEKIKVRMNPPVKAECSEADGCNVLFV